MLEKQMPVFTTFCLCLSDKTRLTQKITDNRNVHTSEHLVLNEHWKSVASISFLLLQLLSLSKFSFVGVRTVQVTALLE